jgi:ATP-binding cassette subfamily B protein
MEKGGLVQVLPMLGALTLGAQKLLPALQLSYSNLVVIISNREILRDVVFQLQMETDDSINFSQDVIFEKSISFENVSFSFSNSKDILRNVNIQIKKGSRVGLIGKTGSGKSTFIDLVSGLLEPTSGKVFVDEVMLDKKNLKKWRMKFSCVPQDVYLKNCSLKENVILNLPYDAGRFGEVILKSKLQSFILSKVENENFIVGERGSWLSGGQKQRVGIARALYKKSELIIFDEATSALDSETEFEVMNSIYEIENKVTVFIVAHRLHTLNSCDIILEFEDGKINVREGINT